MPNKRIGLIFMLCCIVTTIFAQVSFHVHIDSVEFYIGEQTRLTLDLVTNKSQNIILPKYKSGDEIIPNVEVVEVSKPDTTQLNEGKKLKIQQQYVITAWDSTFYNLPPFIVSVDGQQYETESQPFRVLMMEVDTLHVDQFFPPYDVMEPSFAWEDWQWVVLFSFLAPILFLIAIYLYDRARKGKPIVTIKRRKKVLPPHRVAIEEIERIKTDRKWTEEDSKEYYTMLTSTLRTYIQNRFNFNAMEMTSGEIIERLTAEENAGSLDELREIFTTADLVKFAKHSTLINENDANLVAAVEYINQTKQEMDVNAKPEPEIIKITDKKRMNQVLTMRIVALVATLAALTLVAWIAWRTADLLM